MLANLFQLITRRPQNYNLAFVREVRAPIPPEPRSRRLEKVVAICWALIAVKCIAVWWLIRHFNVPVAPMWINAPTIVAAAICTLIYVRRS